MIRKILLTTLTVLVSVMAYAQDYQASVDKFVKASGINPGSVAVKIVDLESGEILGSHNSTGSLVPASIMKTVSIATLLEEVGPDYRYSTRVYIDGPLDMGILRGNLIVEGAGDPSVNSAPEPCGTDINKEIVDIIQSMGINKIEGKIIVDNNEFAGPSRPDSWQVPDFKESYGTGFHAFNYQNNASGKKSVENPASVFVRHLTSTLHSAGVSVDNKELGEGQRTQIFAHLSPQIDEIMRSCMMRSDNLFAESFLRTYGKMQGGDGSTADAAGREYEKWVGKEVPLEGVKIIDGSGLSRSNRVTADFMTAVLSNMSEDATYASFFPLAGQEGTLRKFLAETPLDSYIAMKTGSMNGIQCYAGYKLDEDYAPTHTVVIIMNDLNNRAVAKKAAEDMLLEIFE
ncbi:MAG: hypothetical protein HDR88_16040 [Bacteroides sp.]|nr:hypothetical protein [Bacteroides sp.]